MFIAEGEMMIRGSWILGLIIVLAGCGGGDSSAPAPATPDGGEATPATAAAEENKPVEKLKVDMEVVKKAKKLVGDTALQISFMASDEDFDKSITGKDNAHGIINIDEATTALELVATLPDNKENEFIPVLSKSVGPLKECFALYKKSLETKKPFTEGGEAGKNMAKLAADAHLNFAVAFDESLKLCEQK